MSQFDTLFHQMCEPTMLTHLGRSVSYTPVGGSAVPLTAIVGEINEDRDDDDPKGTVNTKIREIVISRDAAGAFGGIAEPTLNDTIVIDSETWSVRAVVKRSQNMVTLEVERAVSYEVTKPGWRGRS